MTIEVIPLEESHIPDVRCLLAGYLSTAPDGVEELEPPSTEQLEQCEYNIRKLLQDRSAFCYVAWKGELALGFIVHSWSFSISKGGSVLRVDALYCSPKHRRQGVGRTLMQHALQVAKSNDAVRMQLETDDDNTQARALYQQFGFEPITGKGVYMAFL
ncbi:GNAT family N-acetyltransferase [Paenibacillus koleovorans]|uniref:GNAT family N-acetyltransferase n=1 Tax=Paenibacillus koleovorans TaxID=121608 RepID=UPI000FDACDB1|nr:GNAT family N-acetyltransferase [Paenibacillus koleovorans]